MNKLLHIVSFDNPYPPNYGGVIDVYYKIKSLKELNISIILHVFSDEKTNYLELKKQCIKVYYYKRNGLLPSLLSTIPFRVKSRFKKELITNLISKKAPILFEGLHTTAVLSKFNFINQKIYVRTHNIEHQYINGLSKSTSNIFRKKIFQIEAVKFKKYENILNAVDGIFAISPFEKEYFSTHYNSSTTYVPAFHENSNFNSNRIGNKTILFHGDLRVSDNIKACLFLIDTYKNTSIKFVIASSTVNKKIIKQLSKYENCSFIKIIKNKQLDQLLIQSHINVLPTFQKTGVKLKVINALYKGKFVLVNNIMVEDTGLEQLCVIANSKEDFLTKTKRLLNKEFTDDEVEKRQKTLTIFDTKKNAQKIVDIIFN